MLTPILAIGFGPVEITVLAVFGVILFGKRLPEVAKGLGRSVVEFKRGLQGIDDDVNINKPLRTDPAPPVTPPSATASPSTPPTPPPAGG